MKFTQHQERALDTRRHLAVTANAGSGKTRVLVERYVRLLFQGVPCGDVVALTFTDKAASELRRRIAERVREELARAQGEEETLRIEAIRDALPAAFVGTIHSFCTRMLREYPVEAGVDAAFTVLEGVDAAELLGQCTATVLGEVLGGERGEIPAGRFMDLLHAMGKTRALAVLDTLVRRRDAVERLTAEGGPFARTDDDLIAFWETVLAGALGAAFGDPVLLGDLETVVRAAAPKHQGAAASALRSVSSAGALAGRAASFAELAAAAFTKAGEIRSSFTGRRGGDDAPDERLDEAVRRIGLRRKLLDPLAGAASRGTLAQENRPLLGDARLFIALATGVIGAYDRRKEEEARLDFDDLQVKMRLLLRNPAVRAELSSRFRYVMVDEYQDTNALQFEILLPLLDGLASGNLFIVGDPKQSIYRFRGAEVEVFERSRSDIAAASGDSSLVSLGESFRLLADPAAFVNILFSAVMGEGGGIPYDPLVPARMNPDPGGVELLLPLAEDAAAMTQEDLVAARILELVGAGSVVYDHREEPRGAAFRDFALLLRSRNRLEEFEQAFIRAGVPYVVSGGVGYFQTQDVYDVYNYLRFLLDPADDVALAGILRAPFFAASDAEIFELARGRGSRSLWHALRDPSAAGRGAPSLAYAAGVLGEDVALGVRLPPAELIARIVEATGFTAALAGTARGLQAEANIGKLLEKARAFEAEGFTSLYDFVARLRRLMDEEEREGQAPIESRMDAVRIMTVHAAKGLEFPIVIVPDLQRKFHADEEPYIDGGTGLGLAGTGDAGPAPLSVYLRETARRKSLEEEERVLYVACTRARDRLILSSEPAANPAPDSWLGWLDALCRSHRISPAQGPLVFDLPSGGSLTVPVYREIHASAGAPLAAGGSRADARIDIAPIPSRAKGEIFSASRIRTYLECPAKYYYRYVLGLPGGSGPFVPETPGEPGEDQEFADVDYPAELRGRVFHAVMEGADSMGGDPQGVRRAVDAALARVAPFTGGGYTSLADDVASLAGAVIASASWPPILRETDVKTEFAISAALGDDFITGTIDRLSMGADGVWTVLDYKTDAVTESGLRERAEMYWAQLEFYALMVRKYCDADSVRIRLLFARHPAQILERLVDRAQLAALEDRIREIISRIKSGKFTPVNPPCHGCPSPRGYCSPR